MRFSPRSQPRLQAWAAACTLPTPSAATTKSASYATATTAIAASHAATAFATSESTSQLATALSAPKHVPEPVSRMKLEPHDSSRLKVHMWFDHPDYAAVLKLRVLVDGSIVDEPRFNFDPDPVGLHQLEEVGDLACDTSYTIFLASCSVEDDYLGGCSAEINATSTTASCFLPSPPPSPMAPSPAPRHLHVHPRSHVRRCYPIPPALLQRPNIGFL